MSLKLREIKDVFDNVKKGQAILLIGQGYLKSDQSYYDRLLKKLSIIDYEPTLNELWGKYSKDLEPLKSALKSAAYETKCSPWIRAIMSMGWNCVYSSTPNIDWLKASMGSNFNVNIMSRIEIATGSGFRGLFNKKNMPMIPLFGDEDGLPSNSNDLRKMKNLRNEFENPCDSILSQFGYLIIDGLETDDWLNVTKLVNLIYNAPSGCVYIFGMTESRLENMCTDDDTWLDFKDMLRDSRLQLCEKSLEDVVTELGLTEMTEYEDDYDHSGDVKVSVGKNDHMWIERIECTRMQNMGITLMREEIMSNLILRGRDIREEFANFLMQRSDKEWKYFKIIDENIKSFHIKRKAEELLKNLVITQLRKQANERCIVLLKGNSNTGKTTTLRWLAREVYEELPQSFGKGSANEKKSGERYVVLYINGDPAMQNSKWMEDLTEFIKDKIYDKLTVGNQRVGNVIVIWDNGNSQTKRADYEKLNRVLNECNVVLVGSIYEFESRKLKQGTRPIEVSISADLNDSERNSLKKLLQNVDENMYNNVLKYSESKKEYLFELLTHFAEYNYSPIWQAYKRGLSAKLEKEAMETEDVSNKELTTFLATRDAVLSQGIGAALKPMIDQLNDERRKQNEPLENAIADLNLILAVAGQFNKTVALPESLLLRTVITGDNPTFERETEKLRKILNLDSMAKCDSYAETGVRFISFRHSSEASAYLVNTLGHEDIEDGRNKRKDKEIDVVKRLIKNCEWDTTTGIHEAKAVTALIRCFGTNSYGKFGKELDCRGNYTHYSAYWNDIVEELNKYAYSNPDAMLIVGHFTREAIQFKTNLAEKDLDNIALVDKLNSVYSKMENIMNTEYDSTPLTAQARLYGEMCRNLLQQMNTLDDEDPQVSDLAEEFINVYKTAVDVSKKCSEIGQRVGTVLLLDIWLNFVLKISIEKYLSDTLEYIEVLLYDEGEYIDDSEDLVNVISKINDVYEYIGNLNENDSNRLKELLEKNGNDSWAYFAGKRELVKVYENFKTMYPDKFGSKENDRMSPRVFFMNERAADDFNDDEDRMLFTEIKAALKIVSQKVISTLEISYRNDLDKMSFRCLRMYLRAKWMSYTGNLMLEYEQRPSLSDNQWKELNDICLKTYVITNVEASAKSAMNFINSIYRFVFLGESWQSRRGTESPNRRICLCLPAEADGALKSRLFRVSTKIIDGKVMAKVEKEIKCGNLEKTLVNSKGNYSIYVPPTVLKKHPDLKRSGKTNIPIDFEIWFNLGGPQLKDVSDEEA